MVETVSTIEPTTDRRSGQSRYGLAAVVGLLSAAAGLAVAWTFPTTASIRCRVGDCLVEASRHAPWRIGIVLAGSVIAFVLARLALRADVERSTLRTAAVLGVGLFAVAVFSAVRLGGGYVPVEDTATMSDSWMAFRVTLTLAGFTIALATALSLRHGSGARTRARAMALGVFAICVLGAIFVPSHLVCPVERFWVANDESGRCVDVSRGMSGFQPPEPTNDRQLPERSTIAAAGVAAAGAVRLAGSPRSERRHG
jgi:hypothetical protein